MEFNKFLMQGEPGAGKKGATAPFAWEQSDKKER
jgi:hypothetical protein